MVCRIGVLRPLSLNFSNLQVSIQRARQAVPQEKQYPPDDQKRDEYTDAIKRHDAVASYCAWIHEEVGIKAGDWAADQRVDKVDQGID